jgi:lipoprotein-anchoring transpeptidase ErfK/SrfK
MRSHLKTALVATMFACAGITAASANPIESLFEGLFGAQQAQPASAYYGSGAGAYAYAPQYTPAPAYAPEISRPTSVRIPRETVNFAGNYAPGTVIVSTSERRLYYVLGGHKAVKYGIGVGRAGFDWHGTQTISRKQEWPDWIPPAEMIQRRPDLPRYMAGGPENPLGARAMYLGGSLYRIHGSNEPDTIGQAVSSGCIRMLNEDVVDLYERVKVGTPVVVLR